jgi:hypothetical protein
MTPTRKTTSPYKVLRAICIAGERIEIDSIVELGPVLGAELRAAAKVAPYDGDDEAAATVGDAPINKPTEPAPVVRRRGGAQPTVGEPAAD